MKQLCKAALFDFDGVVMDTETGYTRFWTEIGIRYLNNPHFGMEIKGQTLTSIYERYFSGELEKVRLELTRELHRFEKDVEYNYIEGVVDFIADLRRNGVKTAIVTSSDASKMANVYLQHPEIPSMFDEILLSGMFRRSKPAPDCFLKGMECFGTGVHETVVFEDSVHGLEAGTASGAFVVGLSTTYPKERIRPLCDVVIPDFNGLDFGKLQLLLEEAEER